MRRVCPSCHHPERHALLASAGDTDWTTDFRQTKVRPAPCAHALPTLIAPMYWISHAQGIAGLTVLSPLMGAFHARMREWNWLLLLILSVAGGMLLNVLLEESIRRPRTVFDDSPVTLATWSFPRGHTAGATTLNGVPAAYLLSKTTSRRRRTLAMASAVTVVVLVACSRMMHGPHYLK